MGPPPAPIPAHRAKQYEAKLAALNAINSALQKENEQLRRDSRNARAPTSDAGRWRTGAGCHRPAIPSLPARRMCRPLTPPLAACAVAVADEELAELQEEFERRLGQNQRTIAQLKVSGGLVGSVQARKLGPPFPMSMRLSFVPV